jgi:RNA polymerase sigma-70 factor (ECF subfamily)
MNPSDEDLMRDVQRERFEAFETLVERHRAGLLRLAQSRLAERNAAEDVVQETFLAVFAARHSYRPELPFRTWLWTIALNLCKRQAKRMASRTATQQLIDPASIVLAESTPGREGGLQQLMSAERDAQLREALNTLPEVQADALRLRFFGGLKFDEIAASMNCSLNAAKMRVKQGLVRLSRLMPVPEEREP